MQVTVTFINKISETRCLMQEFKKPHLLKVYAEKPKCSIDFLLILSCSPHATSICTKTNPDETILNQTDDSLQITIKLFQGLLSLHIDTSSEYAHANCFAYHIKKKCEISVYCSSILRVVSRGK